MRTTCINSFRKTFSLRKDQDEILRYRGYAQIGNILPLAISSVASTAAAVELQQVIIT